MTEPADKPVGRIRFMDQQRVNLDGFAVEDPDLDRKSTRLNSSHLRTSRMPSAA